MIHATRQFYRGFFIEKRDGGLREILAPFPSLALVQKWIVLHILSRQQLHPCAVAYRPGASIKGHIHPHLNKKQLLKTDIANFFPSITSAKVLEYFLSLGYTGHIASNFASLLTLDDAVPQGAPSSPSLSNLICVSLDQDMQYLSDPLGITYTRYADDFAFSADMFPVNFVLQLSEVFSRHGFTINHRKTYLYGEGESLRFLTGLVLDGDRVRPPKAFRRWIRQKVFYLERYLHTDLGDAASARETSSLLRDPYLLDVLRGKLNYWIWVDPSDPLPRQFFKRLLSIETSLAT